MRSNTDHYWRQEVIDWYRARQHRGLTSQERAAIDRYFVDHRASVLDLGCGAGRTTIVLEQRGYDVHGVDISDKMIREARRICPNVPFTRGDATRLPFVDGSFRYVLFSYNGIDEIYPETDRRAALREIQRVLDSDGRVIFSTRNRWRYLVVHPFTWEELQSVVRFWRNHFRERPWPSPYLLDSDSKRTSLVHYTTPPRQKRELRATGLEPLSVIGSRRRGPISQYFAPSLHFVAAKSSE